MSGQETAQAVKKVRRAELGNASDMGLNGPIHILTESASSKSLKPYIRFSH